MKCDFRQRLLATTMLVGAGLAAAPAAAQMTGMPMEAPPPPDSSATPPAPETTTPAEGQTAVPSTNAQAAPVRSAQDIVITGTRIPQPNLTSASPVTVLTAQEVKLQGTTRTEDLINSLPQSFAAQGSNISNGASGTATVNLRGLGAARTLVLINGRRLQPGDVLTPFPDINFVPTQLIKRVDILTGGASSVYGADAVGGVVNFIMDTTFTGVRIDAQASTFMHDNRAGNDIIAANEARGFRPPNGLSVNGGTRDIAAVMGASFDDGRGRAQVYATYRQQNAVLQSSRDYSFCALTGLTQTQAATNGRRFNCGGSATSATGTFFTNIGTFEVQGNQFVPGTTPFNFAPYNFFQRPDERYTFGGFADYEIAPGAKPYLEAMFMDDRTDSLIAPSGDFFNTASINCDNPLLSAQQLAVACQTAIYNPADASTAPGNYLSRFSNLVGATPIFGPDPDGTGPLRSPLLGFNAPTAFLDPVTGGTYNQGVAFVGRRNVEGGGRENDIHHSAFRVVGGLRGEPIRGISYDAYYQFGKNIRDSIFLRDFSITRLARALDVVTNPATGLPVCRSVMTGVDANCVPYNIFQTGGVTEEALTYLQTPGFQNGVVNESIAHADVTIQGAEYGLKTPWAESGVGLNVGAEYRKEQMNLKVDEEFRLGDLAGQGGPTPPVKGQFDVRELFAEVQIPIVERNFIDLLQISAGYRYSDYKVASNSFKTDTYKLAAEFAPIRDIRFRAAYNRAVRAPNIVELFLPQTLALSGTLDPCAGAAPSATLAQCQLTGVSAAQYGSIVPNPANQYNGLVGGNPNLTPEKADTYTAGVILQPRWIPGLALTADHFNIKVKNLIGAPGFAATFSACFAGDAAACARINRAPGTGTLWLTSNGFIRLINTNFSGVGLLTKGWDFSGSYSRKIANLGTLNASFVGTLLNALQAPPAQNGVGTFAGGTPTPKWRHKARVGFTLPNGLGISGQWRHFSSVGCQPQVPSIGCGTPTNPIPANTGLKAMNFFDLSMTARISQKFNLRFGANNLLDTEPPVAGGQVIPAGFGNGNTYPQVYDSLGRFLFAGVTVDF